MALSSKDLTATVLAACTAGLLYVQAKGLDIPFLSSPRWAAVVVGILGVGMCVGGSESAALGTTWGNVMGILGGLGLVAVLIGLFAGSSLFVQLACWIFLGMWLLVTGRHTLTLTPA